MTHDLIMLESDNLVSELFDKARNPRLWNTLGWVLALSAHAIVGGLALTHHREAERVPPPVELELAPPETPPVPLPEPPAPVAKEQAPEPTATPTPASAPAAPAAARAGALLTAKDDPQAQAQPEGPIDFTNDPTVSGFGGGVVAVGGKADFGVKGARPEGRPSVAVSVPSARGSGEVLTPVSDLGRKPSLGEADPCRGYFPSAATDDVASASVMVVVGKNGAVSNVSVVSESPRAQGFGAAARSCMLGKRFTPALDRDGRPAATAVRVNIRFSR